MKIALLSILVCLFVNLGHSKSSKKVNVKSESSEVTDNVGEKYSGDSSDAEPAPLKAPSNLVEHDVTFSQKAIKRAKKSLSKNRMKRLSKPKYLEEKLREMVEQRPALKKKIENKLAERNAKKMSKNSVSLLGGSEILFDDQKVDVYEVPIQEFKIYEAPMLINEPMVSETPADVAHEPLKTDKMYETYQFYPNENVFALENEIPFGTLDQLEQGYPTSRVFSRSVIDQINEDLIAIESNPAFDVHPISEIEMFDSDTDSILNGNNSAAILGTTSIVETKAESHEIDPPVTLTSTSPFTGMETLTLFPPAEDSLEAEPFRIAESQDESSNPKFKKDILFNQYSQELFSNDLHFEPACQFPADFIIESPNDAEHFWAPLEPVKTYEIKQINIDEEAIISELKNALGDVTGPIIIGEPGEPVIVKHYAKPYVIEYYERQVVVEHHQKANLNVFRQPPVVVDHYEPVIITEIEAEPLVVIEEVCPCIGDEATS